MNYYVISRYLGFLSFGELSLYLFNDHSRKCPGNVQECPCVLTFVCVPSPNAKLRRYPKDLSRHGGSMPALVLCVVVVLWSILYHQKAVEATAIRVDSAPLHSFLPSGVLIQSGRHPALWRQHSHEARRHWSGGRVGWHLPPTPSLPPSFPPSLPPSASVLFIWRRLLRCLGGIVVRRRSYIYSLPRVLACQPSIPQIVTNDGSISSTNTRL